MAKESTRWKQKHNPGLRVARCCSNCANCLYEFQGYCNISISSDRLNHPRGSSEVCDNWCATSEERLNAITKQIEKGD